MTMMEGLLSKWTNVMKGWQYRWFVLDDSAGLLSYYTSRDKMIRGVRRGCVRLKGAIIGIDDEDYSTFTITVDSKTFHFQAKDRDEREKWIRCLEDAILRHAYGYKCLNYIQTEAFRSIPNVLDFQKKLCEADAYLQLLIDQSHNLETRLDSYSEEDKSKCDIILSHSNNILDQVKHTIVLLQIAKNAAQQVNGTYQPINDSNVLKVENLPSIVPETSYSSSEEDFYDAYSNSDPPSTPTSRRPNSANLSLNCEETQDSNDAELEETVVSSSLVHHPTFLKPDGSLDYDALYGDSDEDNNYGFSLESQGSVITHLLSQVKIGMDLTKVVLPTFILERRSLLEMFADYFAHPDLFVKIADLTTERERMVQVVKWYLSSYHAGRKCSVAKKPYNPILGEIFQCYWDLPGTDKCGDQLLINDGPVPWCSGEKLTFVAEQVSHRPPISAFYAEHFNEKITFMAHVWTKSKFLGLSIAVHNIGNGKIDVMKYDEQYIVTFPNGYGRSILTVPWIELGGNVTIDCEKTGYKAAIEFLTKPFYGGKKHRVHCEVFAPNEKKPFLIINGEWNGILEAKWSDGRIEEFIDVNRLKIIKKNIRPIDQQEDNESRKLWKDVTAGLRLNNVDHASNAKYNLEQKQRMEAQQRKENGIVWETKLFEKDGEDGWVFSKPLRSRLSTNR